MVGEEFLTIKIRADRQELLQKPQNWVLLWFNGLFRGEEHFDASHDEEHAEQDDDPVVLDQNRTHGDEDAAEDQRTQNAVEEDPVLVFARDIEVGEDHHEHEDVIHRQRLLDDVAGEKLQRAPLGRLRRVESRNRHEPLAILQTVGCELLEEETKHHSHGHPNDTPSERFAESHLMRGLVKNPEVERQHEQDKNNKRSVEPPILGKWK